MRSTVEYPRRFRMIPVAASRYVVQFSIYGQGI